MSRTERRNAEARSRLVPLRAGERPTAVTVAAILAFSLAAANIGFYAAGGDIDGRRPAGGVIAYSVLLLVAAGGLWRARYWAVLGMQALLALVILVFSALVIVASNVLGVVVSLVAIAGSGTLFWFLVKAMARIQMPERR
jgi:hypothetical protein